MPLYVESLNDVLAVAGTASFEGGQVSGIVPNLINDNAVSEALNMTITPGGNYQSRLGIESMSTRVSTVASPVQGMFYFDTPSIEQLLVATSGTTTLKVIEKLKCLTRNNYVVDFPPLVS